MSYRNPYLKHCHEIAVHGDRAFFTSTGFDSVLEFDLRTRRFVAGFHVRAGRLERSLRKTPLPYAPKLTVFDPESVDGPTPGDTQHINSVSFEGGLLFFSGTGLRYLLSVQGGRLRRFARIPRGTHNARPYRGGVLTNTTTQDAACWLHRSGRVIRRFPVPQYPRTELLKGDIPSDHARPAFARGLTVDRGTLVVGSSPATLTAFDIDSGRELSRVNLTMDVRHAIHGLEIWPHAAPWEARVDAERVAVER
jgi:hypothetical protein